MSEKEPKMEMEIDPSLIDEAVAAVESHSKEPQKTPSETTENLKANEESDADQPSSNSEDYYDKFVRLMADFENFRKRTVKEKSDLVRHGNENLVRELLPVLDNFERALASESQDVESIRTGVEMIFTQLKSTLENFGVKSESAIGKPFDPLVHEAVSHVPSDNHEAGTVIDEHQKAYFLKDRLVRPAIVSVAKEHDSGNNAQSNDPTQEPGEKINVKVSDENSE